MALSACGAIPGLGQAEQPTPETTPTRPLFEGFTLMASNACLLADLPVIQTDKPQGDVLAWAGDQNVLAFVAPSNGIWGWYSGKLEIVSMEDITAPREYTKFSVYGDLAWSPDDAHIGFIALRPEGNIYTVMALDVETLAAVDLMPGMTAATDIWASQKGIKEWEDEQNLVVASSCGSDCVTEDGIDITTLILTGMRQIRKNEDQSLALTLSQPEYDEALYPPMLNPSWSPDSMKIAFLDEDDQLFVFDRDRQGYYPLDTATWIVSEAKWSSDSRYLALRADAHLYIYDMECP